MSEHLASLAANSSGLKTSRAQQVYDALLAAMQEGNYKVGERMREEEIARALGVSRTPVREALSRLQARGLLEIAAGGLVIATLSRQQVVELYAMREILEGSAARFAAQHASPTDIAAMRHFANEFKRSLDDPARLAVINRKFHDAITEAAHNRYLMRTLIEHHDTLALLPSTTFTVSGRPHAAVEEHEAILEAIESRDADKAERLAREHIQKAHEARRKMMFEY